MPENVQDTHDDAFVNSIIGEGTLLKGEFELNGLLRIDGIFYGKVKTNGKVLVGKNGVAECDIYAGTIVIGGKVKGSVIATERITLLSTGILVGNIVTPRLVIEEGVIFDGTCEIIKNKDKLIKMKEQYFGESVPFKKEAVTKDSEAIVTHSLNHVAKTVEKTNIT
jgi:cytoskeletal protein CcmA (bactofilin family)